MMEKLASGKKMSEEQTSKINWITRRTDRRRKKADWYSIMTVSVVLRGWREIISKRDSMEGGFIWRHLSALLLLRNQSFMLCASMSASNICLFPALLFAVYSLGYYPTPLLESGFFFPFFLFPMCINLKFWWANAFPASSHPYLLHKSAEVRDKM